MHYCALTPKVAYTDGDHLDHGIVLNHASSSLATHFETRGMDDTIRRNIAIKVSLVLNMLNCISHLILRY